MGPHGATRLLAAFVAAGPWCCRSLALAAVASNARVALTTRAAVRNLALAEPPADDAAAEEDEEDDDRCRDGGGVAFGGVSALPPPWRRSEDVPVTAQTASACALTPWRATSPKIAAAAACGSFGASTLSRMMVSGPAARRRASRVTTVARHSNRGESCVLLNHHNRKVSRSSERSKARRQILGRHKSVVER